MAKKSKKAPVGLTKKQASLSYRDQQAQKRVIAGVAIGAVIVLGLIVAGLVMEFVVKPNSPVATVNGERITTEAYQKRVRYQRYNLNRYISELSIQKNQLDPNDSTNAFLIQYYDQLLSQAQTELENIGPSVLEQMIEEALIRQEAAKEGIVVSEEQVDQQIEQLFGYQRNPPTPAPTPTPSAEGTPAPEPTPTATPISKEEFQRRYAQYLENLKQVAGFNERDYRELIRANLYRAALQELLASRVPTKGEQVWARHILVEDEATARTVLERLRAGEDFAALAKEFSKDDSNKDSGGDLGWFGRGTMVQAFEDVAFALAVGEISEPVKTDYGFHIIKVEGHEMEREFDSTTLSQLRSQAFSSWLASAQQKADIQRFWTADKVPPETTPFAVD